ncbi:MAG: 3-deoxy-8-phosphooctulonate synthase [Candidatus Omnitrophica bacterium]|nr:3-deoxy-8-phosphooctulonate synthase [Candidatus Omnitrophota bacterium]
MTRLTRPIRIGELSIGGTSPLVLIGGPCVIESEVLSLRIAARIKGIAEELHIPYIFKSSYDKANRSSIRSFRGPGLSKGLKILSRIKKELRLPVLSDVHTAEEVPYAAEVLDVLQIPAFLCRQTDLVLAVAKTGKPVNVKKGQFLAPWDMKNVIEKIESAGNRKILLTERGVSFGYNLLVNDFRSLQVMRSFGYPVIFDATHSTQLPGGLGDRTGGQREFVPALARAACAVGCDGLFLEVHENPNRALSDGSNMIFLKDLKGVLEQAKRIDTIVDRGRR